MIIGIAGKKQSGKDTICKIIQAYDIFKKYPHVADNQSCRLFIKDCLTNDRLPKLKLYRDIYSSWEKHAFADKLKQCVALILNCPVEALEDEKFKNSPISWITKSVHTLSPDGFGEFDNIPITVRQFLQMFGTEVGRNISSELWVNALMSEYFETSTPVYATTDGGQRIVIGRDTMSPNWVIPDVRFPNEAESILKRNGILIHVIRPSENKDEHASEISMDGYNMYDYTVYNDNSLDYLIAQVMDIMRELSE